MKTQDSENLLSVVALRNTRSKTSSEPNPISFDLIVDIFSRLPAKSVARCRCVSKLWASTLRLPYFTELFLTRSLSRPQLLFFNRKDLKFSFFSSPLPQNLDDESSSLLASNHHMEIQLAFSYPTRIQSCWIYVNGLIFLRFDLRVDKKLQRVSVICNPSTGQYLTLPKVKSSMSVRSFYFGYDPIKKQHKILSMSMVVHARERKVSQEEEEEEEHQVLTLGTREKSWRKIECLLPPYRPRGCDYQICINGVLYYSATNTKSTNESIIVCFDVRSEKFSFIKDNENAMTNATLINYNGKLGLFSDRSFFYGHDEGFKLRVLEDALKEEWSEQIYSLPSSWENLVGDSILRFVGITRTKEIVLSSTYQHEFYYVYYYNTERNTITRVEIKGMEEFKVTYTVLDYVEDVKLL